jgi:predicted acetyltransferase
LIEGTTELKENAMPVQLVEPSLAWKDAFLDMAHECLSNGDLRYLAPISNFDGYLEHLYEFAHGINLPPNIVQETSYWAHDDGVIVGVIRLRHRLNPALEQIGGHIGYEVRPSRRRMGYGTEMLRLVLEPARQLGLKRVLLTCDATNIGSARIMEKNGGVLTNRIEMPEKGKTVLHYWINLE